MEKSEPEWPTKFDPKGLQPLPDGFAEGWDECVGECKQAFTEWQSQQPKLEELRPMDIVNVPFTIESITSNAFGKIYYLAKTIKSKEVKLNIPGLTKEQMVEENISIQKL